jgi:SAM-dependent methyltransferase
MRRRLGARQSREQADTTPMRGPSRSHPWLAHGAVVACPDLKFESARAMAKKKKHKGKKKKMAALADRHDLYQRSVQNPEADIHFFNKTFRKYRKRKPLSMKEDFCGTAFLSTAWVKSNKKRTALGVDLDQPTLDWGTTRHLDKLKPAVRERITLVKANVLDITEPKFDITCALNFSYCIFKERELLTRYFKIAHQGLKDDGIFYCELFGGTEAIVPLEEERDCEDFIYVWDQDKYNPITNEILCHIHFDFEDGSRMKHAFTYDWRLWTIPEVRECLLEAGFSRVDIWWDPVETKGKDEWYRLSEEEENQEGWLVYFAALK